MKTNIRSFVVRSLIASSTSVAPPPRRDPLDGLVRRAACGDRAAIATLGRLYRPRMVKEARKYVQAADAEDVVQGVFLLMLEGLVAPPRSSEPAVAWLLHRVASLAQEA